jgi:hypothetical protein
MSQQLVRTIFINEGHADQGVFLTIIKAPSLIDSALYISGVLGPAVVKVNKAISVQGWEDGRMYEFAHDFVRRVPFNANGIHPLKAIFEALKNLVFENGAAPGSLRSHLLDWLFPFYCVFNHRETSN